MILLHCHVNVNCLDRSYQQAQMVGGNNSGVRHTTGCPRCGKAVYFAEERIAIGKKWHKMCLKCGTWNGLSFFLGTLNKSPLPVQVASLTFGSGTTFTFYNKSTDIIPRRLSSEFGLFYISHWNGYDLLLTLSATSTASTSVRYLVSSFGVPSGFVYQTNFLLIAGSCNKLLDSGSVSEHDGDAYCKTCYSSNFGPKGYGFAGGSAGLAREDKGKRNR